MRVFSCTRKDDKDELRRIFLAIEKEDEWILYHREEDQVAEVARIDKEAILKDGFIPEYSLYAEIDLREYEVKIQIIGDKESSDAFGSKERIKNCMNSVFFLRSISSASKKNRLIYHLTNDIFNVTLFEEDVLVLGMVNTSIKDKSFAIGDHVTALRNYPCHQLWTERDYVVIESNPFSSDDSTVYLVDKNTKERIITKKKFLRKHGQKT